MLLQCCLLHIDMILPRHVIFCLFVSISNSMSFKHFQPGGIDLLPLHLLFSKTKNNINLKLCMVVIFYINFQKIILLCPASSWFDDVIIPILWVMVFFAFSTFSKNVKYFHFKSVLNNPKLFKKQWKQLFIIYNHKTICFYTTFIAIDGDSCFREYVFIHIYIFSMIYTFVILFVKQKVKSHKISGKVKHELRVTSSNPRVTSSNSRVRRIKARVARLKARVGRLKARVGRLKARVRRLKARVDAIKPRVR